MEQLIPCYICPAAQRPQTMVRLLGENNAARRDIAIRRRANQGRDPLVINVGSRICNNCNRSIAEEIIILANDPVCLRLNVLTQASNVTCLICNGREDLNRLTLNFRIDIYLKRNIYVLEDTRCCPGHLTDEGLLMNESLPELRFFYRPIILRGTQLQPFLQGLRETAENNRKNRYES